MVTDSRLADGSSALALLRSIWAEVDSSTLSAHLDVDEATLNGLLSGRVELDEKVVSSLSTLCSTLDLVGHSSGIASPPVSDDPGVVDDLEDVLELDHWGEVDEQQAVEIGVPLPVSASTYEDQQERRRKALWRARNLAIMTQFRLDISWVEQVTALGAVTQFELALIMCYGDTLPEPGASWDPERKSREVQRRLAILRWVDRQRDKEQTWFKVLVGWMQGRGGRMSGKDMYQRMLREASAMTEDDFSDSLIQLGANRGLGAIEVMGYSGRSGQGMEGR